MRSLCPALLLLLVVSSAALAQSPEKLQRVQELESLRGLSFVFVSVVADGMDADGIKQAIRKRLVDAGVKTHASDATATLRARIWKRYDERQRIYAVAVTLRLTQLATVKRPGWESREFAPTWERRDVMMSRADWKPVSESLAAMVDEFIDDFLSMNPVRLGILNPARSATAFCSRLSFRNVPKLC